MGSQMIDYLVKKESTAGFAVSDQGLKIRGNPAVKCRNEKGFIQIKPYGVKTKTKVCLK